MSLLAIRKPQGRGIAKDMSAIYRLVKGGDVLSLSIPFVQIATPPYLPFQVVGQHLLW